MLLYNLKYPKDFVLLPNDQKRIIHTSISLTSEEIPKYETWKKYIYHIFSSDKDNKIMPHMIIDKLDKYIDKALIDRKYMDFLEYNQWLLRFASKKSIDKLIKSGKFVVENEFIDVPVDYYELDGNKKIIYETQLVPEWEIPKRKEIVKIIEWILSDSKGETIADKLSTLSLSNQNFIKNIICDNTWLLMLISDIERREIIKRLDIPYTNMTRFNKARKRDSEGWYIDYFYNTVPNDVVSNYDIEKKMLGNILFTNNIFLALYNMCYNEKNYSLIAHNPWLLDLISEDERRIIINIINGVTVLEESTEEYKVEDEQDITISTRKIISISPKEGKDRIYSTQLDVPLNIYKDVKELNNTLYGIIDGTVNMSIEEFIESSPIVLTYWPWLKDYDKYITKKR